MRVLFVSGVENRCGGGMDGVPCKLFVVDVHLLGSQRERGRGRTRQRTYHDYSICSGDKRRKERRNQAPAKMSRRHEQFG